MGPKRKRGLRKPLFKPLLHGGVFRLLKHFFNMRLSCGAVRFCVFPCYSASLLLYEAFTYYKFRGWYWILRAYGPSLRLRWRSFDRGFRPVQTHPFHSEAARPAQKSGPGIWVGRESEFKQARWSWTCNVFGWLRHQFLESRVSQFLSYKEDTRVLVFRASEETYYFYPCQFPFLSVSVLFHVTFSCPVCSPSVSLFLVLSLDSADSVLMLFWWHMGQH